MQPTPTTPNVQQVPLLTANQIAQFKRDGFLVLPAVLDPELCRQCQRRNVGLRLQPTCPA